LVYGPDSATTSPYTPNATGDVLDVVVVKDKEGDKEDDASSHSFAPLASDGRTSTGKAEALADSLEDQF
jgi:hypothetical protein